MFCVMANFLSCSSIAELYFHSSTSSKYQTVDVEHFCEICVMQIFRFFLVFQQIYYVQLLFGVLCHGKFS